MNIQHGILSVYNQKSLFKSKIVYYTTEETLCVFLWLSMLYTQLSPNNCCCDFVRNVCGIILRSVRCVFILSFHSKNFCQMLLKINPKEIFVHLVILTKYFDVNTIFRLLKPPDQVNNYIKQDTITPSFFG